MDDGVFDALPGSFGEGLAFAAVVAAFAGLWWLVKRTRQRHFDELQRRHDTWKPPPEPDDPRQLPPPG